MIDQYSATNQESLQLLQGFPRLRIAVIGDAMLDTYLEGRAERLCSEGPVPVVRKTSEEHIPGGAANSAINVCSLGATVFFLGIVGRDVAGHQLRQQLQRFGVADHWLIEDAEAPTLQKVRIVADGCYVARVDEGDVQGFAVSPHYLDDQKQLLGALEKVYAQCDLVIISDYRYGAISTPILDKLLHLQSSRPLPILVDSKALHRFETFPATVITPNLSEARAFVEATGGRVPAENQRCLQEFHTLAEQLLARLATQAIAITLGKEGVYLQDRQGLSLHLSAHPVLAAHDVGAGDSFASAMALTLAAGGSLPTAAQMGLDAAHIAITQPRTAIVPYQALLHTLLMRSSKGQGKTYAYDVTSLVVRLDEERRVGRRIVFTNGVFDILHAGHTDHLCQMKALGDVLVVGMNSDASTQKRKGLGRPINNEQARIAVMTALEVVDYVVLFNEDTPCDLIRQLRPHMYVKGGDYQIEELPEASIMHEIGGEVIILPRIGSFSTTQIVERIHVGRESSNC